jgi:DNA polymerase (family 10)
LGELFKSGKSKHFDEVMKDLPKSMFVLMMIPGVGAKRAYRLATEFNITGKNPIDALKKLAMEGKIAGLEGFGEDLEKAIISSIEEVKGREFRLLLPYAMQIANDIITWMKKSKAVLKADALGSLRRHTSTVGDVDIAVSSNDPEAVIKHFTEFPNMTRILEKGDRTASIVIPGSKQVDLMVEKPESYGSLLQHFTGSKHHNIAVREYALKKGYSVSDYGINILDKNKRRKELKKFESEEDFYKFLGMEWIPPELREGTGEVNASLKNELPDLVKLKDIKADLQIHSDFDIETSHDLGMSTMEEIVQMSNNLGYEYVAFTEHNPSHSRHTKSRIIDLLKAKKERVDEINLTVVKSVKGSFKKVFNSLEIDILPDGSLPVPEEGLSYLDFALVSVHSSFRLDRDKMTQRVLTGLNHPKVKIFAHPTARLLNEREGIELDWEKIFDFCLKNNKWIEINADPKRLDLPDFLVREAVKKGIKLTLGTDAHHKDMMNNMEFAVSVARRGWAEKNDIINTCGLIEFEKLVGM